MNIDPKTNNALFEYLQKEIFENKQLDSLSTKSKITLLVQSYDFAVDLFKQDKKLIKSISSGFHSEALDREIATIASTLSQSSGNSSQEIPQFLELQMQQEISHKVIQLINDDKFKDFSALKEILKGKSSQFTEDLVKELSTKYQGQLSQMSRDNSKEPIESYIFTKIMEELEKVAEDVYLIDSESLNQLRQERMMREIINSNASYESDFICQIPELKCAIKDISKETLETLKIRSEKQLKILINKVPPPAKAAELQQQLDNIQEVLTNWENRETLTAGQQFLTFPASKSNVTKLSSEKLKALEQIEINLKGQILTASNDEKGHIDKQIQVVQAILYKTHHYQEIIDSHNHSSYKAFMQIDPLNLRLKLLADIPLTPNNQDFLIKAWNRVLIASSIKVKSAKTPEAHDQAMQKYEEAYKTIQNLSTQANNAKLTDLLNLHKESAFFISNPSERKVTELKEPTFTHPQLQSHEIEQLRRLSKILKDSRIKPEKLDKINEREKIFLQKFIFSIIDNQDLNSRLLKLDSKIPFGISSEVIQLAKTLSFKSHYHSQFTKITSKTQHLMNKLDHPETIRDDEKISLKEFGILNHLASLVPLFISLNKAKLLGKETYLDLLYEKSLQAKEMITNLNERFQNEVEKDDSYHDGDISAWHSSKWQEFLVKKPTSEVELMRTWVTAMGHGAYLYRADVNEDGNRPVMQSHIYGLHENEPVSIQQAAFGEVWRLQVPRLIDKTSPFYQILKEIYQQEGKNVDEEIQKQYEAAAHQFHSDSEENQSKFADMENDSTKRFDAGKADYGLKGGHKRWNARTDHFAKVHKQFAVGPKNPGEKKYIICSEFVTKATIASLIEADIRLTQKIKEFAQQYPDDSSIVALAKALKTDPSEGLNLIQLPYDEKERLKRIHPGRMIDLLAQKNCIIKIEPPSIIREIFSHQTFHLTLKSKDLIKRSQTARAYIEKGDIKKGLQIVEQMVADQAPASYYQNELERFGLKPGEWTAISTQTLSEQDPFFASGIKFTPIEKEGLQLLSAIHQKKIYNYKATDEETILLKKFFVHIYQNKDFNQRINQFITVQAKNDSNLKIFNSNVICYLKSFSFKTDQTQLLFELAPKITAIADLVETHQETQIHPDDRLSLNDFRLTDTFCNMQPMLSWAERLGICDDSSFIGKIKSSVDKLDIAMQKIEERFSKEVNIESGDIILDVLSKGNAYEGKTFDVTDKVDWFLFLQQKLVGHTFQHAALGLRKERGLSLAELDLHYQNPSVGLGRLCIADAFRLDWFKLVPSDAMKLLKRNAIAIGLKGEEIDLFIQKYLQEKFQTIIEDFFKDEEKFKNIENSAFRQITSIFRSDKTDSQNFGALNFNKIQNMTCSEFAILSLAHCLHKMNGELQNDIAQGFEKEGISKEEAELMAKKVTVVTNPVKTDQNFAAVHIDRLYEIFRDYIRPVEMPNFLKYIQMQVNS